MCSIIFVQSNFQSISQETEVLLQSLLKTHSFTIVPLIMFGIFSCMISFKQSEQDREGFHLECWTTDFTFQVRSPTHLKKDFCQSYKILFLSD